MERREFVRMGNHLKAGLSSAAVLLLTSVHHLYGAAIYRTLWRAHIVVPATLAMVFIIGTLYISHRYATVRTGQIARWLAIGAIALIPVAWIGLFEGGYNHVVKDLLYFSGTPLSLMHRLFPPPIYELPDDAFFELTGVLQFFVAPLAGYYAGRLVRSGQIGNQR